MKLHLILSLAFMNLAHPLIAMSWKQDLNIANVKTIEKLTNERWQVYKAQFTNGTEVCITSFLQGPLKGTFHGTSIETTSGFDGHRRQFELPLTAPAEYFCLLQGLYEAHHKKESATNNDNK